MAILQYYYYLYSITVWSAAPQTTLWGGPEPRFEPGPGGQEAGTLPLDHHTSFAITTLFSIVYFRNLKFSKIKSDQVK